MKTTLEIPDPIFRRAKARAAEQHIPLRQFVTDAVEEKLKEKTPSRLKARTRLFGGLRHLKKETARINRIIEEEFERIDPEDWA
ncbi:MAG TPA: antitoxin [Terriglobia bacterium]|nr:antitoxin [Terriglobia bacterium]